MAVALAALTAAHARQFRSISPIPTPSGDLGAAGARLAQPRPVPFERVREAVHAVAEAWNTPELNPLLAPDFVNRSRLLDTVNEVVPRDAQMQVLGIASYATLDQRRLEQDGGSTVVSTVSAVVRLQVTYDDPREGFRRLQGRHEMILRFREPAR